MIVSAMCTGGALSVFGYGLGRLHERRLWLDWVRPKTRPVPPEGPFPGAACLGARDD